MTLTLHSKAEVGVSEGHQEGSHTLASGRTVPGGGKTPGALEGKEHRSAWIPGRHGLWMLDWG